VSNNSFIVIPTKAAYSIYFFIFGPKSVNTGNAGIPASNIRFSCLLTLQSYSYDDVVCSFQIPI